MSASPDQKAEKTDEFLALYRECERRIFAYLMAMLGNPDDAEEVLQETLLALWQSFDDFQPGTNFHAWARQAAYHRVLIYRRLRQRQGVSWDESLLTAVDKICSRQDDRLAQYLQFLDECVAKLTESDRGLLQLRFQTPRTIKSVAEQLQRPADTVYKALARIYQWLAQCVERAASVEEHT
jgi:RNA polymerase sigma-70 factor, ECF subfamily